MMDIKAIEVLYRHWTLILVYQVLCHARFVFSACQLQPYSLTAEIPLLARLFSHTLYSIQVFSLLHNKNINHPETQAAGLSAGPVRGFSPRHTTTIEWPKPTQIFTVLKKQWVIYY